MKKPFILLLLSIFLLINNQDFAQDFWKPTNGREIGIVYCLSNNSIGHIFVGGTGGLFRSTNNGENWKQLTNGLNENEIYSLAVNSSDHIFVGTYLNGIFCSTDNGNSWTQINNDLPISSFLYVTSLAINSNNYIFAGTNEEGIFLSIDNGQNWTQINNGLKSINIYSLAINTNNQIFAGGYNGVFRSTNNGESWSQINNGLPLSFCTSSISINSNDHIVIGDMFNQGIFLSIDNGENWKPINNGLPNKGINDLVCNSIGHIFVTLGYHGGGVYRSTDNGLNWVQISGGIIVDYVTSLLINSNGYIYAGTGFGGTVYTSIEPVDKLQDLNIAYGKAVTITTNGADDNNDGQGEWPADITDGSLEYKPASSHQEDGVVGFVNNDYNQLMEITATINLEDSYQISKIRYNQGNVENAETWNADIMESPFGSIPTKKGTGNIGAWTEQTGNIISNEIKIKFKKNRISMATDWLFIGEVEIYGIKVNNIKTPIIFVPGIMGSPLYNDENRDNHLEYLEKAWITRAWYAPANKNLIYLPLNENGLDPGIPSSNIVVAPLRNDPPITLEDELKSNPMNVYKNFFYKLKEDGYVIDNYDNNHSEGENLFCFTYDWRKNNTVNAQLLSEFIDSVKEWTGTTKITLIGHSMGGIVSKKCISISDKSRIDKMIFIGTPHLGAPEVITVLLSGKLFDWLDYPIVKSLIKLLARNLPSNYQLSPSNNYFNLDLKNNISSGVENYLFCFQLPNGRFANYSEMNEYLKTYSSSLGETLNPLLIDDAESFRESISYVAFGDILIFNIVGYNFPTIGENRILQVTEPFNLISNEEARTLNGDQTVPLRSAEIINNEVIKNTYYILNVVHSNLPSSSQALEIILGILKNQTISDFPKYAKPPDSYSAPNHIEAEVSCPIALHAYDSLGRHTGPTTDTTWEANIPGSEYIPGNLNDSTSSKTILLPTGNTYRFEMKSLNRDGIFNFFLQEVKNGSTNKFLVYNSIPFQTNTTISCSLNTVSSLPTLEVDLDNNGTIDTVIVPQDFTVDVENNKSEMPKAFLLSQNYPNPFNSSTRINYSIPRTSFVNIKLYDILGREITTLVNEEKPVGSYEVEYNGNNLPSGIYFYRLQAGSFSETKKFVLLK